MIDVLRIQELRAEIGDEDLSFIVSVYLDEARTTLAQVAGGLPPADYSRAVHFLRSGALNIGLSGIATMAGRMEEDMVTDPDLPPKVCASRLSEALDATVKAMETALD